MRTLGPARRQVNMIETRKREHSRKPDEQYPLIEACSPGPYLEMFARSAQAGWTAWGDESGIGVVARGKVHKGYSGGPIQAPQLAPHSRLDPYDAVELSQVLRDLYESGASVRQIAQDTNYSITRVRSLLAKADTRMRSRGRAAKDDVQEALPIPA